MLTEEQQLERFEKGQLMPHATLDDVRFSENADEEKLAEYLKTFLKPSGVCWLCEHTLYVEFGIIHGEVNCCECGIPARAYHYIEDNDGKKVRIERTLQYHPNTYSVRGQEEE